MVDEGALRWQEWSREYCRSRSSGSGCRVPAAQARQPPPDTHMVTDAGGTAEDCSRSRWLHRISRYPDMHRPKTGR